MLRLNSKFVFLTLNRLKIQLHPTFLSNPFLKIANSPFTSDAPKVAEPNNKKHPFITEPLKGWRNRIRQKKEKAKALEAAKAQSANAQENNSPAIDQTTENPITDQSSKEIKQVTALQKNQPNSKKTKKIGKNKKRKLKKKELLEAQKKQENATENKGASETSPSQPEQNNNESATPAADSQLSYKVRSQLNLPKKVAAKRKKKEKKIALKKMVAADNKSGDPLQPVITQKKPKRSQLHTPKCKRCGQGGHKHKDCTNPYSPDCKLRCFRCQAKGHLAKDCVFRGKCKVCGRRGHNMDQCTAKRLKANYLKMIEQNKKAKAEAKKAARKAKMEEKKNKKAEGQNSKVLAEQKVVPQSKDNADQESLSEKKVDQQIPSDNTQAQQPIPQSTISQSDQNTDKVEQQVSSQGSEKGNSPPVKETPAPTVKNIQSAKVSKNKKSPPNKNAGIVKEENKEQVKPNQPTSTEKVEKPKKSSNKKKSDDSASDNQNQQKQEIPTVETEKVIEVPKIVKKPQVGKKTKEAEAKKAAEKTPNPPNPPQKQKTKKENPQTSQSNDKSLTNESEQPELKVESEISPEVNPVENTKKEKNSSLRGNANKMNKV